MWVIYAMTAAVVWGLDYALGEKILRENLSPASLLFIQMLAGIVIFGFILARGQFKADWQLLLQKPQLAGLVVFVAVTFNIGNFLVFSAIKAKNATMAGLLELTYPIFTIFFSWILFQHNYLTLSVLIGSILIFSGVTVLTVF